MNSNCTGGRTPKSTWTRRTRTRRPMTVLLAFDFLMVVEVVIALEVALADVLVVGRARVNVAVSPALDVAVESSPSPVFGVVLTGWWTSGASDGRRALGGCGSTLSTWREIGAKPRGRRHHEHQNDQDHPKKRPRSRLAEVSVQ